MWTSNPLCADPSPARAELGEPALPSIKSLQDCCISALGKWFHLLHDVGGMDVDSWIKVIRAAGVRATVSVIARVEENCGHLECTTTDNEFWRPLVERGARLPTGTFCEQNFKVQS